MEQRLDVIYADNVPGTGDQKDFFNYNYKRIFSPWSTPVSTNNIAIEIVSDSSGLIFVDFFVSDPINASPSKPQNIRDSWGNNHPRLDWMANIEPDFQHYEIWKKQDGAWSLRTTTTNNHFVDIGEDKFSSGSDCDKVFIYYKVLAIDSTDKKSGFTVDARFGVDDCGDKPVKFELNNNYPNPFNIETRIPFRLPELSDISLKIFDISGREITVLVVGAKEAGFYTVTFNASGLSSGIYIYKLIAKGLESGETYTHIKRMLLIK